MAHPVLVALLRVREYPGQLRTLELGRGGEAGGGEAGRQQQPARGPGHGASHAVRWSRGCGHVTPASRVLAAHITAATCHVSLLSRRCGPRGGRGATAAVRWLLLRCCQVVAVAGLHCSSGRLLISGAHVSAALCLAPPKGYGEGSIKYCSTLPPPTSS